MKNILFILAVAAVLGACQSSSKKAAAEKDRLFKDSIARADGDKVLGNIRFGMDPYDFLVAKLQFFKDQDNELYGYYIQDIEGLFSDNDRLYGAKFVGLDTNEYTWDKVPFRDFLLAKFGKETDRNVWRVGDRTIVILREKRTLGLEYMRKKYGWHAEDMDWNLYPLYMICIVSDSMYREQRELRTEENRQREIREQEKRENDLKSL